MKNTPLYVTHLQIQSFFTSDFNPLKVNPTKWSNTLKQFVGFRQWIGWMCLTILWSWRLKY